MRTLAPVQEFRDKPSKRNSTKEKRRCQHKKCMTVLSVYNLDNYCSLHQKLYSDPKSFI